MAQEITIRAMRDEMRTYSDRFDWTKEGRAVLNRAIKFLPPMYKKYRKDNSLPWINYSDMKYDMQTQVYLLAESFRATRKQTK